MWKVYGRAYPVGLGFVMALFMTLTTTAAIAQTTNNNSSFQNNNSFSLPGVTLPQGHDEVRAADGTTCRSAISGDGAYLDMGVIGNPEQTSTDSSVSAYTRIVIPLGEKRNRIDCSKLYNLEVRRLEIELKLMELGLNRGIAPISETSPEVSTDVAGVDDGQSGFGSTQTAEGDPVDPVKVASADEDDWAKDGWTTEGLNQESDD
jgi:hypothetical protein